MPFVGPFVISLLVSSFWSSYAPFCYSIWHTFSSQQYDTVNIQRLLILKCFICCNCTNDQAVQVLNYPNCSTSYLGREELVTIPAHARCAHTCAHTECRAVLLVGNKTRSSGNIDSPQLPVSACRLLRHKLESVPACSDRFCCTTLLGETPNIFPDSIWSGLSVWVLFKRLLQMCSEFIKHTNVMFLDMRNDFGFSTQKELGKNFGGWTNNTAQKSAFCQEENKGRSHHSGKEHEGTHLQQGWHKDPLRLCR